MNDGGIKRLTLIVVDDEVIVRKRFKLGFPLKEHGFDIVGEAEDGEEALSLCERLNPDIVITDVVMPRMNGLELTKALKEKMPHIKVIILSNYQEFEFARKAVKFGAVDYLLKVTAGFEELLEILQKVRTEIANKDDNLLRSKEERYLLQQSLSHMRSQFVVDVVNNFYSDEESLNRQIELFKIPIQLTCFSIAMVSIDDYRKFKEKHRAHNLKRVQSSIMKIIEEAAGQRWKSFVFRWKDNMLGIWIDVDSLWQYQSELKYFEVAFDEIIEKVRQYERCSITISVSGIKHFKGIRELSDKLNESIYEAEYCLGYRFYYGGGKVCFYNKSEEYKQLSEEDASKFRDRLAQITYKQGKDKVSCHIYRDLLEILRESKVSPSDAIMLIRQVTIDSSQFSPETYERLERELKDIESADDAARYLESFVMCRDEELIPIFERENLKKEIVMTLDYVAGNYHRPVNIEDICHHINISPSYFSHLFKQQTGMNFTYYINYYRTIQAQRLLRYTSMKVQEIAVKVGISDYRYFLRIFRRITGQTPAEWRDSSGNPV